MVVRKTYRNKGKFSMLGSALGYAAKYGVKKLKKAYGGKMSLKTSTAFKGKGAGSKTVSVVKKKPRTKEISRFSGVGSSFYSEHHKLYPKGAIVLRANPVSVDRELEATRMTWGSGAQNVTVPFNNFLYSDMLRILSTDLGANASGFDTTRIFLKRIHGHIKFANMTNANSELTIYDIVARQDMTNSSPILDPVTAWKQGLLYTSGNASNTTYLTYGDTPFMSNIFCRLFKVKKVTKVDMMPGRDHTHYFSRTMNCFVNNEMNYLSGAFTPTVYGGKSHFIMIVGKGFVSTDSVTHAVTSGSGEIESIIKCDYEYGYPTTNLKHFNVTGSFGAITNLESVINDLTGAVQTFAQA